MWIVYYDKKKQKFDKFSTIMINHKNDNIGNNNKEW